MGESYFSDKLMNCVVIVSLSGTELSVYMCERTGFLWVNNVMVRSWHWMQNSNHLKTILDHQNTSLIPKPSLPRNIQSQGNIYAELFSWNGHIKWSYIFLILAINYTRIPPTWKTKIKTSLATLNMPGNKCGWWKEFSASVTLLGRCKWTQLLVPWKRKHSILI